MGKIVFGIVGSGWRTEFYLRIARELPEIFEISGVVTRQESKGKELEAVWGVKSFRTVEEMLKERMSGFVVVSVSWEAAPDTIRELVRRGVAVLTETPPAPDLDGLIEINRLTGEGARIQVAEQYHLQPLHAARNSIVHSGKLGQVSQVQLSVCHGYHAVSLMRRLLDIGFENARISASQYVSPIIGGPGREGAPKEERREESRQVVARLQFGDKLCLYDFTDDQYFSWIRSQRILVRGDRGEITDTTVRYLKDYRTPIEFELKRRNAGEDGNLEGYFLKGILAGEEWAYVNPFIPGKLTDDEIAVASCLVRMEQYVLGGPEFYSLAEASQDHYLSMMIQAAVAAEKEITTETQSWALR